MLVALVMVPVDAVGVRGVITVVVLAVDVRVVARAVPPGALVLCRAVAAPVVVVLVPPAAFEALKRSIGELAATMAPQRAKERRSLIGRG